MQGCSSDSLHLQQECTTSMCRSWPHSPGLPLCATQSIALSPGLPLCATQFIALLLHILADVRCFHVQLHVRESTTYVRATTA